MKKTSSTEWGRSVRTYAPYLSLENAGRERDHELEDRENSSEEDSTLVQQQQYLSWSGSSVHSNSYPMGHFNSFSFSIVDPPIVVRGGIKQTS
jgi:hypothetical protein